MIRDIAFAIGDFFQWTFKAMPVVANGPNIIISLVITAYFIYWLGQIRKHSKAGEN